jgi:hypothetical protein
VLLSQLEAAGTKPGGLFAFATVPIPAYNLQIKWMGWSVTVSTLGPEEAVEWIKKVGFRIGHEAISKFTPKGCRFSSG